MENFLYDHKIIQVAGRNAGTTATTVLTDPIDTLGFDSLAVAINLSSTGAASGGITAIFQHGETTTSFVNTTTTITTNGPPAQTVGVIDITKLTKRYARVRINPDHTDACPIGAVNAFLYNPNHGPAVQSTGFILDGMSVVKVSPTS